MTILNALLRKPLSLGVLAAQIGLTLAIVVNAAFIADCQIRLMQRPSGLDEANLFVVEVQSPSDLVVPDSSVEADIAAIKEIPAVMDVTHINFLPLGDGGWRTAVANKPLAGPGPAQSHAALFFADENVIQTLGLRLISGRNISADDVGDMGENYLGDVRVALISKALADTIFPGESPLNKTVYSRTMKPLKVIGVIGRMESAWPELPIHENSLLIPAKFHWRDAVYAIRTNTSEPDQWTETIRQRLLKVDSNRVVSAAEPYRTLRSAAYRTQFSLVIMLCGLIVTLLIVTAVGIGGTVAFGVTRRIQQIGTRRALGATRGEIVRQFMFENFLSTSMGVLIGCLFTFALNHWLMSYYHVQGLPWHFLPMGVLMIYLLGQVAVLGPAFRAASIPPAVATRGT